MNIYVTLIKHEIYEMFRSPMWGKNLLSLALNIVGFGFYLFFVPLMGYYFGDILFGIRPGEDPLNVVGSYLPQYFITTAVFLALSLNINTNVPLIFLTMPGMRGKVVWYILTKSLLHGFQRLFLLFFIPFAWHYILPQYGIVKTLFVILGYVALHLITTLLVVLLKNFSAKNWLISLGAIITLIAMVILNRLALLDTEQIGLYILGKLISLNILFYATLLLTLALLMEKNYTLLSGSFTSEMKVLKKVESESWLGDRLGGQLPISWLYLVRLIGYDNLKRPSFILSILTYCIFMILVSFVPNMFSNTLNMLMYFQMLASSLVVNIIPSFFTLSSSYMDGLNARKTNLSQLLVLHYRMILAIYFLLFLLWAPILYFKTDKLWLLFSLALFHAGFSACIYLLNGYLHSGRVELGNRKRTGGGKMMGGSIALLFVVWLLTIFMYSVIGTALGNTTALVVIASIGVFFISTHSIWLREIIDHLEKNKYKKLETYRAK